MQNGPAPGESLRCIWGGVAGGIEGAASALSSSLPGVWMYNEATTRRHHVPTGRAGFKPVVLAAQICHFFPLFVGRGKLLKFVLPQKETFLWNGNICLQRILLNRLSLQLRPGQARSVGCPAGRRISKPVPISPVGRAGTPAHLG